MPQAQHTNKAYITEVHAVVAISLTLFVDIIFIIHFVLIVRNIYSVIKTYQFEYTFTESVSMI